MASVKTVRPTDPPYLQAAFSVLGLSEIEGSKHEKKVLEMYAASGHPEIHDDETPWCAAYVGWALQHGGLTGTQSLMAKSYATYGTALARNKTIPRGAIAVWTRAGGGHVNFVLADDGTYVTCIGGNQSNNKGGGVTISRRAKSEAVAYRMPPQATPIVAEPETDPAPEAMPAPESKPPSILDKVVPIARTIAGVATGSAAGGQVASTIADGPTDVAEKATQVVNKSGEVISATKQVITVPKPGFWNGLLAVVSSPGFLVSMIVLMAAMWFLVWFIQRQHQQQAAKP